MADETEDREAAVAEAICRAMSRSGSTWDDAARAALRAAGSVAPAPEPPAERWNEIVVNLRAHCPSTPACGDCWWCNAARDVAALAARTPKVGDRVTVTPKLPPDWGTATGEVVEVTTSYRVRTDEGRTMHGVDDEVRPLGPADSRSGPTPGEVPRVGDRVETNAGAAGVVREVRLMVLPDGADDVEPWPWPRSWLRLVAAPQGDERREGTLRGEGDSAEKFADRQARRSVRRAATPQGDAEEGGETP